MPRISSDDERFDVPELILLQVEHEQHVERGQADAPHQRQAEQQVQRDGRADHLGEIARGNRDLAEQPQHDRRRARVVIAAGLREIAAAGDAEPQRQRLQQDRHQVRQHDHAQQRVAVPRAAGQVGRPVAGIHVADGDQVARAGERQHLAPEAAGQRDRHRPVHFRQADRRRRPGASRRPAGASAAFPGSRLDILPIRYTTRNPLLKQKARMPASQRVRVRFRRLTASLHGAWGLPLCQEPMIQSVCPRRHCRAVAACRRPAAQHRRSRPDARRNARRRPADPACPTSARAAGADRPEPDQPADDDVDQAASQLLPAHAPVRARPPARRLRRPGRRSLQPRRGAIIGLEYRFAITGNMQAGVHRSMLSKTIQTFGRWDALRQGDALPVSVSVMGSYEG